MTAYLLSIYLFDNWPLFLTYLLDIFPFDKCDLYLQSNLHAHICGPLCPPIRPLRSFEAVTSIWCHLRSFETIQCSDVNEVIWGHDLNLKPFDVIQSHSRQRSQFEVIWGCDLNFMRFEALIFGHSRPRPHFEAVISILSHWRPQPQFDVILAHSSP